MSYEPTNWKSGDVVTAAKLNKLEQGVASGGSSGGGVLVVNVTEDDGAYVCDKTAAEIYAACPAVVFQREAEVGYAPEILQNYYHVTEGQYAGVHGFITLVYDGAVWSANEYQALSGDDYPQSGDL